MQITHVLQRFLPIWILVFAVIAFLFPGLFTSLSGVTPFALAFIFLLMGMSISFQSFIDIVKKPKALLVGMAMKWSVTVMISVGLAYLFFQEHPSLAAGVILAGTVPSGTSANLYTLIAEGTVALSITLAAIDTFIAPFMTPLLMDVFAGKFIPVSFWELFLSIVYIVFIPILAGLFLQWKWEKTLDRVRKVFPTLSIVSLLVIVLAVISSAYTSLDAYSSMLPLLFFIVAIQVAIPMFLCYVIARFFGISEPNCRAILFHTGICNTALSATLAMNHIDALAAVPSVVNMVVNLSLGAFMANWFSRQSKKTIEQSEATT
ncbi:bile acid:sodium symporter family protein [Desertibacillus haloalkaliphilus]|nr:bile acid:sodium symporter family protein [Desertibacillus haloalkaliphilus]